MLYKKAISLVLALLFSFSVSAANANILGDVLSNDNTIHYFGAGWYTSWRMANGVKRADAINEAVLIAALKEIVIDAALLNGRADIVEFGWGMFGALTAGFITPEKVVTDEVIYERIKPRD